MPLTTAYTEPHSKNIFSEGKGWLSTRIIDVDRQQVPPPSSFICTVKYWFLLVTFFSCILAALIVKSRNQVLINMHSMRVFYVVEQITDIGVSMQILIYNHQQCFSSEDTDGAKTTFVCCA